MMPKTLKQLGPPKASADGSLVAPDEQPPVPNIPDWSRSNYGNKTKSHAQHEELLDFIAWLDRQGHTQRQIMEKLPGKFGFTLTQGCIAQKLAIIKRRYRDQQLMNRNQKVNEQLEALRDVRREAWAAYFRSMEDATKETVQWERDSEEVAGGDLSSSEVVAKRIRVREGRLPENAYLQTIMQTHKAERDLLGLDEEVYQNMMAISEAEMVLRAVLNAQREVLADQPLLLAAVQKRCLQLIPMRGLQPAEVVEVRDVDDVQRGSPSRLEELEENSEAEGAP